MQAVLSKPQKAKASLPIRQPLPSSFLRAAGILRRHAKAFRAYGKKVRQEWAETTA